MDDAAIPSRKRRPARESAPTTPDPIEIAMEAAAAKRNPEGVAHEVLRRQSELFRWQIASERAGFVLKLLIGAAGVAAALALVVFAVQASRANGLVVEPFGVPPELEQQGLSGAAVSSQVLDELAKLEARSVSGAANEGRFQAVQQQVKVAIPTTGISLGDLQTALRDWLGHETHINGEVYRTPAGGLAIRARISGREGVRIEGGSGELEDLTRRTAHAIFGQTKPAVYADMIGDQGDRAGAIEILKGIALGQGPARVRARAYNSWSYHIQFEDLPAARALSREAIALAPDFGDMWTQASTYEGRLGRLEDQVRMYRRGVALMERNPDRTLRPEARDLRPEKTEIAILTGDVPEALAEGRLADANPFNERVWGGQLDTAVIRGLSYAHDIPAARARLAAPRFMRPGTTPRPQDLEGMMLARLFVDVWSEDWADALGASDMLAEQTKSGSGFLRSASAMVFMAALVHAEAGDAAGARERLQPPPPADCAHCLYYAAMAYAALGDVAASERDFAAAARLLSTLPQAHLFWGKARLTRGDAAGALPLLREAGRRQPHWADPFKYEGDALAALGRWPEAEAAYAKAEPLAPNWGGLHLKRGQTLAKLGKAAETKAQFALAASQFLTAAERAELGRVQGGR